MPGGIGSSAPATLNRTKTRLIEHGWMDISVCDVVFHQINIIMLALTLKIINHFTLKVSIWQSTVVSACIYSKYQGPDKGRHYSDSTLSVWCLALLSYFKWKVPEKGKHFSVYSNCNSPGVIFSYSLGWDGVWDLCVPVGVWQSWRQRWVTVRWKTELMSLLYVLISDS